MRIVTRPEEIYDAQGEKHRFGDITDNPGYACRWHLKGEIALSAPACLALCATSLAENCCFHLEIT